jgi:hypothetical protein
VLDLFDSLDNRDPFRSLDLVQHRQRTYQAIIRLFLSECRVQPVIAVFEDLHFTDSLTLGLLNELVVAAQHARSLVLVSYRPEYRDVWGTGRIITCYIWIPLAAKTSWNSLRLCWAPTRVCPP